MARSLRKLSAKDLFVKNSAQDLLDYQNERRATKRAIWHAQSAEKVAWGISKFAPRHNESDLRGPKWREGCASRFKMSTAPQRERFDRPKVPTGLRERSQTSHCTTMRATRCAQSDEKVARAHVTFSQKVVGTTKNEHWKCQNDVLPRSQLLFCRDLRSTAPATKNERKASEVLHLPRGIITISTSKVWRQVEKTRFSTLSKRRTRSPNTAPATQNDL